MILDIPQNGFNVLASAQPVGFEVETRAIIHGVSVVAYRDFVFIAFLKIIDLIIAKNRMISVHLFNTKGFVHCKLLS